MSEMTTAEMVARLEDKAKERHREERYDLATDLREIAARLSALDKVAKAAKAIVDAPSVDVEDLIWPMGEALKEAGYGT